jgi:hypothetical protein
MPSSTALPLAGDCCAPLREPLSPDQAGSVARTLKALADPTRPGYGWSPWSPPTRAARRASAS